MFVFLCFLVCGQGGRCKGKIEHFRSFSETFRSNRKFPKISETEFVGVLGRASFRTNLKAVLVMDYTRTLLINNYMAIGAVHDFLSVSSSPFLEQETQLCKIPNYVSMIYSPH